MPPYAEHDPPGTVRRREAIAFVVALASSDAALLAAGIHPSMEKADTNFWVITACVCTAASVVALYTGTDKGTFHTQYPLVSMTLLTIGIGAVLPWLFVLYCRKPGFSIVAGVLLAALAFCGYMTHREEKRQQAQQKLLHLHIPRQR